MVTCRICERDFKSITRSHLKTHNITLEEYKSLYPDAPTTKNSYISFITANHGSSHPNWKGGISGAYKHNILFRDNNTCQLCNAQNSLCVHTIDDRKSKFEPSNLITLCRTCLNKSRSKHRRVPLRTHLSKIAKSKEAKRRSLIAKEKAKVAEGEMLATPSPSVPYKGE